MSRRNRAVKRKSQKDPRYDNELIGHFINMVMREGKKSLAQRIVYGAFARVSEELRKRDSVDLLLGALENTRPKIEVKSRRVGGATYQVPLEIPYERQQSLALRWIIDAAESRKGMCMQEALALVIVDAYNNTGPVVERKNVMHKNAQANRMFAHLRW